MVTSNEGNQNYSGDIMNNFEMQEIVIDKIKTLLDKFNSHFDGKHAFLPEIRFTKRGKCAGCVTYKEGKEPYINFNMTLLKENFDDFVSQTVPHETAHFVTWIRFGHQYTAGGKRIIHGTDWKNMMSFFEVRVKRCHSYNTANSTVRKMKRFTYKCGCMSHELTTIRHNKVVRGTANYSCSKCGEKLVRA